MTETLQEMMEKACWAGTSIFNRNKTSGSSANMSFVYEDKIYITCSGSCFGNLTADSFSVTDMRGNHISGPKPSKELPLHVMMYTKPGSTVKAVIHVHSHYATLWSCLPHEAKQDDVIPSYTPYLGMKLGKIRLVPYAPPGSEELFASFKSRVSAEDGYLLAHHGPVVGGNSILKAFYALEELEESAQIAWELRNEQEIEKI